MYIGTAIDGVKAMREAVCPGIVTFLVADEVLRDLNQCLWDSVDDSVAEHCVAQKRAVIWLVVADDEVLVLGQHLDQRPWRTMVHVPQNADVPGPHMALHDRR